MSARAPLTSRRARAAALAGAGVNGLVRRNAGRHVAHTLGRLRGLPHKLGQMLAGSDAAAAEFTALYDAAEPLALELLLPGLERALGGPWQAHLRRIEPQGLAASLGQVHRATLHDGREVALKLRYPGIVAAVEADLGLLGWLSTPFGGLARGFDLDGYRTEIAAMLAGELDYRREAAAQCSYRALAAGSGVCVPEVLPLALAEDVLVSAWEAGTPVQEAARWSPALREEAARTFLAHALELCFVHGVVHADPHPGNLRWRATGATRAVLYDHGCVLRLSEHERGALVGLLGTAAEHGDPLPWLVELGFDGARLARIGNRLAPLVALLFEPFLAHGRWEPRGWDLAPRSAALLGEERWNFRQAGPPRLLYLLRAVRGWVGQLERLEVSFGWRGLVLAALERAACPASVQLESRPCSPTQPATSLELCVERDGVVQVRLALPASALERLDELLDVALQARIAAQGIELAALVERARASGYAAQPLFELCDGTRRVKVELA